LKITPSRERLEVIFRNYLTTGAEVVSTVTVESAFTTVESVATEVESDVLVVVLFEPQDANTVAIAKIANTFFIVFFFCFKIKILFFI
jgi:hypothetical protein